MPAPGEAQSRAAFIADLRAECQAFSEFRQILQAEQDTLLKNEVDTLLRLAQSKADKVTQLSQLGEKRSRYLAKLGFTPDRNGMSQWIVAHGGNDSAQVTKLWHELLDVAGEAQRINQSNGIMIETRLRHNQQALAALQAAANQGGFYGPDGQTHWYGIGRPLGKV
ncbi:MAG: flagellar protein FlgN [Pseudomonadota bacterium]